MTTQNPLEIRTLTPEPRYQCEGAGTHPPDPCVEVHHGDREAGYLRPQDLWFFQLSQQDTQWNGFFCQPCVEAVEKYGGLCDQCGNQDQSHQKSQVTLQEYLEAKPTPNL